MTENDRIVAWACSACGWSFRLRTPTHPSEYAHERRTVVMKLFDSHVCDFWKDIPESLKKAALF